MALNVSSLMLEDEWKRQQNYDLYKLGTFVVLLISIISLIAMYFLCPFHRHRKLITKTIIQMKSKSNKKKKRRNFFDTRSISANTEFDFAASLSNNEELLDQHTPTVRPHPSILKIDPKHTPSPTTENISNNNGGVPRKTTAMENNAEFLADTYEDRKHTEYNTAVTPSTNRKSTSFAALPSSSSISRGQLKDRKTSIVTFDLDSKNKQNKYNTIATEKAQSSQRRGLAGLNLPRNKQLQYFCGVQNEQSPMLTRRSSSSQDLAYPPSQNGESVEMMRQQLSRRYSMCASIPDFQSKGLVQRANGVQDGGSEVVMMNPPLENNVNNEKVCDDDIDEGQMQCVFEYDSMRNMLTIKDLHIKASFPAGVPGFLVEISMEPKTNGGEVARSKVYITEQQHVEVRLEEKFCLSCDDLNVEQSSIVITLVPILGNLIFYVETELSELSLLENGEIFLGGFFKGLYISKTL